VTVIELDLVVDPETAAKLQAPRADLLQERLHEDGAYRQERGPFTSYERVISLEPLAAGSVRVRERTDFRLGVPLWRPLINPLMKRAIAETDREPKRRWWWPQQVLVVRSVRLLSAVSVLSIMAGYMGVLIGQTITFAALEFGNNDVAQTRTLAAIRVGIILSVVAIRRADRIGRRPLVIGFAAASLIFTVLGATAGSLVTLGAFQAISRGFTTGLITLLTLAVTEEVPAEVRALGISLMAMCAGLGAGMVLWILPIADSSLGAWRWVYVAPVLFIPGLVWAHRTLPETRRYDKAVEYHAPGLIDRRRFLLIGGSAFIAALFLSPASQLMNEYLRDDLAWSAGQISLFRLLTGTPAGLVILGAGLLADRVGRKPVGGTGLLIGATASALVFFVSGGALWILGTIGFWLLAGAFPALRGYQTELFATRARAKVGGWIDLISVSGSAVGLLAVGILSERWGSLGLAMAPFLAGPIIVALLVFFVYPETAGEELEVFNPADPELAGPEP